MHEVNCVRAMFGAFISAFVPRAREYANGHIRVARQASSREAAEAASGMYAKSVTTDIAGGDQNYFPDKTGIFMPSPQSG